MHRSTCLIRPIVLKSLPDESCSIALGKQRPEKLECLGGQHSTATRPSPSRLCFDLEQADANQQRSAAEAEEVVKSPNTTNWYQLLRQILSTRFDESELRTLCFDLRIDYADLPPGGKADKARELVARLDRHDRIPELVNLVEQQRPDIVWRDN